MYIVTDSLLAVHTHTVLMEIFQVNLHLPVASLILRF